MSIDEIFMYFYMVVSIILVLIIAKPFLYKRMYGERYLDIVIIDTGYTGKILFDKELKSVKYNGIERVYNKHRVYRGVIYYESDNSEPLAIEQDVKSYKYFCDTANFDSVINNKLFQMMLFVKEKNLLVMILIVCIVSVGVSAWLLSKINGIEMDIQTLSTIIQKGMTNKDIVIK